MTIPFFLPLLEKQSPLTLPPAKEELEKAQTYAQSTPPCWIPAIVLYH